MDLFKNITNGRICFNFMRNSELKMTRSRFNFRIKLEVSRRCEFALYVFRMFSVLIRGESRFHSFK